MMQQHAEVADDIIIAELFRLARSGRHMRVATLRTEAAALFPEVPDERIQDCLKRLARMLAE